MSERLDTPGLALAWSEAPWDTAVTGYPVWQIDHMALGEGDTRPAMAAFESARDRSGVGLVSCRLPHDRLRESLFLEEHGFRFIEMLYQPEIKLASVTDLGEDPLLNVRTATEADLPTVVAIAGTAFANERFHMDPRLGPRLGNPRYQNWIKSCFQHPTQLLSVLSDEDKLVAFFVTETLADGLCYWHLNAVAPEAQGQGYGRRAWRTMLQQAAEAGARRVRTSIVARNVRVLNLYARLGFRFLAPQMTFHWVRPHDA